MSEFLPYLQEYWGVFFFGILIATTAMSTGIDGAMFWGPVLLLFYGIKPSIAISCAIFIELFGFGSGVYGYAKHKKIMYKQACFLLCFTIPCGVLGAWVSKIMPQHILIFCIGITCIALVITNFHRGKIRLSERDTSDLGLKAKPLGAILSSIGGLFGGAIGVGIGESNNFYLLSKNRYPVPFSSGTTVFMIAMTDLTLCIFNAIYFNKYSSEVNWYQILSVLIFAVPSVVLGARVGVFLAHRVGRKFFNYFVACAFTLTAILSFYRWSVAWENERLAKLAEQVKTGAAVVANISEEDLEALEALKSKTSTAEQFLQTSVSRVKLFFIALGALCVFSLFVLWITGRLPKAMFGFAEFVSVGISLLQRGVGSLHLAADTLKEVARELMQGGQLQQAGDGDAEEDGDGSPSTLSGLLKAAKQRAQDAEADSELPSFEVLHSVLSDISSSSSKSDSLSELISEIDHKAGLLASGIAAAKFKSLKEMEESQDVDMADVERVLSEAKVNCSDISMLIDRFAAEHQPQGTTSLYQTAWYPAKLLW